MIGILVYKLREIKSPVMHDQRGYRMVLARYNMDQWNYMTKRWQVSFAPRYLVAESGDYTEPPTREVEEVWAREMVAWLGISDTRVQRVEEIPGVKVHSSKSRESKPKDLGLWGR